MAGSAILGMILTIIAGAGMAIAIGLIITRSVIKKLGTEPAEIGRLAQALAEGRLDLTATSSDRATGAYASLTAMVRKLTEVLGAIRTATDNVTSGSEQISTTAQTLSQGATEQAAGAEEVSSSMEEMAATTRQNTESAASEELAAAAEELSGQALALREQVSFFRVGGNSESGATEERNHNVGKKAPAYTGRRAISAQSGRSATAIVPVAPSSSDDDFETF